MSFQQLYLAARKALRELYADQASGVARELVAFAAGMTVSQLVAAFPDYASEKVARQALGYVERAAAGEPLAYILGRWEVHGLPFLVTPDVLIPRDDTEAVVALALSWLRRRRAQGHFRVLDLCTGSGCSGLTLAHEIPELRVTLGDISRDALRIARQNARQLGLTGRAACLPVDATGPAGAFLGRFDMIVANPPYVTRAELAELEPSVREYEPHLALDGGEDGLDFYRAIIHNFTPALLPGGCMLFEFGLGQQEAVGTMLQQAGFARLKFQRDTGDIIRAVLAQLPEPDLESMEIYDMRMCNDG